jgi:transcriptional regulator with XRE-family HTH domain
MKKPIHPKQARLTLGLNQTKMADAMGCSRSTWLHWERGERDITAAPARLLMTLLWLQSIDILDIYLTFFSEKSG